MRSERDKMLAGEPYLSGDPELVAARLACRRLLARFNHSDPGDRDARTRLLRELCASVGESSWIEPPFSCDYGTNIRLGHAFYANFNCVVLDCAEVTFGDDVLLGPAVQIYTAGHPLDAEQRSAGVEFARPVHIGSRVWLGGGAIVLPGVTIGDGSVIGAGSVVTRDIPAGVLAHGNPCRVVRQL
jgi:maltose O-acetyltransferase